VIPQLEIDMRHAKTSSAVATGARWQQERGGKSRMEWFAPPLRQADVPD
jgi:hypothetical protein